MIQPSDMTAAGALASRNDRQPLSNKVKRRTGNPAIFQHGASAQHACMLRVGVRAVGVVRSANVRAILLDRNRTTNTL